MQDFDCKSSTDLEPQRKRLTCFLVRHRNATVLQTAGPSAKIHPLKCLHSKHPLQSSHFNLYAISGLDPPTHSYPTAQKRLGAKKRPGAMHLDIKRRKKLPFSSGLHFRCIISGAWHLRGGIGRLSRFAPPKRPPRGFQHTSEWRFAPWDVCVC